MCDLNENDIIEGDDFTKTLLKSLLNDSEIKGILFSVEEDGTESVIIKFKRKKEKQSGDKL